MSHRRVHRDKPGARGAWLLSHLKEHGPMSMAHMAIDANVDVSALYSAARHPYVAARIESFSTPEVRADARMWRLVETDREKFLLGIIRNLEWGSDYGDQCPLCGNYLHEGHKPACDIAAALQEVRGE